MEDATLTKRERKELRKMEKNEKRQQEVQQRRTNTIIKLVLFALFLGGIGYWIYNSWLPIPTELKQWPVNQVTADDWVKGNPEADIVIVEYSDLQCPACKLYTSVLDDLAEKYASEAAIVYRHFPLKQIHLQAEAAAQAAEAAGLQGKFWEMHDELFATQELWSGNRNAKNLFVEYATNLGLDTDRFKRDMNSKEVRAKVEAHYLNALENRLNSTPAFFLNGNRIENPQGTEAFSALIEAALAEATVSAVIDN